ncbi:MAG: cupin domain-containing protein [Bacillati bacterium ANGP1]|uniref:Cupin domain-containing protein n=1 Tax=Candidatus Segetimicrobium genomatis TaxID=2569760 RepID=A0A537JW03_9BACT|nr:MAG: cupin domain-containing protein [Terrabacteria group bacterium ANGP1]
MPARRATCVVISPDETFHGKQDLDYFAGISAESAGSTGLCMHLVTIPPQARATPHLHERHETAIYVLSGEAGMWYGEGLRQHLTVKAGQLLYIPANVPHLPYNPSATVACIGVLARTDPKEQESVVPYPVPDPGPAVPPNERARRSSG